MAVDGSSVCFGDPQWSRTLNVPARGSVSSPRIRGRAEQHGEVPSPPSERGGDLSSFPLQLSSLFVLVSRDEQQPSVLSSSETKCCLCSRPASSKLAA